MNFGEQLAKVLKELKVSRRKLATMAGVEATYISRIINENMNVSWNTIQKFADALGISPAQFFAHESEIVIMAIAPAIGQ